MKNKYQRGFSLTELLVAIAISVLVIGALYTIYAVANKSYKTGSKKTEIAQNGRTAMERMSREIKESGSIVTNLPLTNTDPLNPPTNHITFKDNNYEKIRYIKYYLTGNQINRKVIHYYVSDPETWVEYNEPGAILVEDEDYIITNNITNLQFYGHVVITIEVSCQIDSETFDLMTKVKPRNL